MNEVTVARKELSTSAARKDERNDAASGGLRIGEPNGAFEREADRVADEIMSAGAAKHRWSISSITIDALVRSKCSGRGSGGSGGECEGYKQEKEGQTLQRKAAGQTELGIAPPIVHEVLDSPGQPLDSAARVFFEPRYQHDLGAVRVHTDARAAQSARAAGAVAYSVGPHIAFDAGRYAPGSASGLHLIAHELAHVVQQAGAARIPSRLAIAAPNDWAERAAEKSAAEAMHGRVAPLAPAPVRIHRQTPPPTPAGSPPAPVAGRIVQVDTNVFLEIGRGNAAAAQTLRKLSSDPNVKVIIPLSVYAEVTRVGDFATAEEAAAYKVIIDKFKIEVVDRPREQRMPTYQRFAEDPSAKFGTQGAEQLSGKARRSMSDITHLAQAKDSGAEILTFDEPMQKNARALNVDVAPESKGHPIIGHGPGSIKNITRLVPEVTPADLASVMSTKVPRGGGTAGGAPPSAGGAAGGPGQGGIGGGKGTGPASADSATHPTGTLDPGGVTATRPAAGAGKSAKKMTAKTRTPLKPPPEAGATPEVKALAPAAKAPAAIPGPRPQISGGESHEGEAPKVPSAKATPKVALGELEGEGHVPPVRRPAAVPKAGVTPEVEAETPQTTPAPRVGAPPRGAAGPELEGGEMGAAAGAAIGEALKVIGAILIQRNFVDPQNEEAINKRLAELKPEIEKRIEANKNQILTLTQSGKTAYVNVTVEIEYQADHDTGLNFFTGLKLVTVEFGGSAVQKEEFADKGLLKSFFNQMIGHTDLLITFPEYEYKAKEGQAAPPVKPPAAGPKPRTPAHATPPGVQLPSAPQGFPSIEEQRGKGKCPTCHDQPKEKEGWHIPEEFKKPMMTDDEMRAWLQGQGH